MAKKYSVKGLGNLDVYFVIDSEDEIYMQFNNYDDALNYYDTMKQIYKTREFKLVKMEQRILHETNKTVNGESAVWYD